MALTSPQLSLQGEHILFYYFFLYVVVFTIFDNPKHNSPSKINAFTKIQVTGAA
jgi:hypothetical protein